jgi:Autotransporter beta-domain
MIRNVLFSMLFVIGAQYMYANDNLHIEIQSGTMSYWGSEYDRLHTYSEKWMLGTGVAYDISPYVEISGIFSYHHFEFNNEFDHTGAMNYSFQVDAPAAHSYETSIGIRIITIVQFPIQPYLSLRRGYDVMAIGDETYKETSLQDNKMMINKNPGETIRNTFWAFGLGVNIPLSNRLNLKAEGYWSEGSSARYTGIIGAFQFSIF